MNRTDPIIDSDFPGGNIVVDSVDGDLISLHQELRDTTRGLVLLVLPHPGSRRPHFGISLYGQ